MKQIRVIQYGLGPIGKAAVKAALNREGIKVVGAVDIDPKLVGKDLGEVLKLDEKLNIPIAESLDALNQKADVAIHCTSSFLPEVEDQLKELFKAGLNVVSSTEELLYPELQRPAEAKRLDRYAKKEKVTALGTGINPGYILDTWALFMTGAVQEVDYIEATRYLDASKRRGPLQRKVGSCLTVPEFRKLARQGQLGHRGLPESLALVVSSLGWELDRVERVLQPMVTNRRIRTRSVDIRRNHVAGIWESMIGYIGKKRVIKLDLRMYSGCPTTYDKVKIVGKPDVTVEVNGGYHGDVCTAATLVNNVKAVLEAEPGIKTMAEVAVPRWNPGGGTYKAYNFDDIKNSYPDPTRSSRRGRKTV
jgi:2,4-diaminopentanoate dehydrogenase